MPTSTIPHADVTSNARSPGNGASPTCTQWTKEKIPIADSETPTTGSSPGSGYARTLPVAPSHATTSTHASVGTASTPHTAARTGAAQGRYCSTVVVEGASPAPVGYTSSATTRA